MKSEMAEHGFDPRLHQRDLLKAWESFVDIGALDCNLVSEYVAESWQRAQYRKIDPFHIPPSAYLDPIAYGKRKEENRYLVSIAKPFMEDMYRYLEKSLYLIMLYDIDGYHLLRVGQRTNFEGLRQMPIREGLCFDERVLGTTGFSLAKRHTRPIQIIGCEHYVSLLHHVVGYYAPINDPIRSELMGVIGVTTARTIPNPHTMALAVAASTSIEHGLRIDHGRKTTLFYVHLASPRSAQDLVVINCAAIPSELMESTLFGHEKGAFTGALHAHIGKFELADRGTVFLDEIGEMPLTMQAKLLRVLEEAR